MVGILRVKEIRCGLDQRDDRRTAEVREGDAVSLEWRYPVGSQRTPTGYGCRSRIEHRHTRLEMAYS
ncbi:hypothetical protein CSUI_010418 [Cystoisospora suis]|uniref:Uncharacterized protein n=1 Tax=Cystoisospora suis TaxID=483139 RepID=A0A2C6JY24_9APIC|nr:hypothetical protein CSUI_010418 [Cystoisospora suis]